ncbi:MAG: ABC transporter ATP-binding protein [bacterium]|nr:ABC transporter ATP-binding protein [bacterium]
MAGVSLCYRLAKQRNVSIKEYLIHLVKGALVYEELWALKDIDLRVEAGEVLGIVGRNGAGKSTLAKVIAGVIKPTQGERRVEGIVSPILELGTGFDYELTGYENIFLNALLLGRQKREIEREVDDIVEFSGLGEFIETPMRSYSSGMIARLGFSIATAWLPTVLILDEVLAVGDARFVARCQERLDAFREQGTTIIMISHALNMLQDYSTRCIWIERGELCADGSPAEVLGQYFQAMAPEQVAKAAEQAEATEEAEASV